MNYFVNYKNGKCSIETYRFVDAVVTDMNDLIAACDSDSDQVLVVNLESYLDECAKAVIENLEKSPFEDYENFKSYILEDADFLDRLCNRLNVDHTDHPDIRAYQLGLYDDYSQSQYDCPAY